MYLKFETFLQNNLQRNYYALFHLEIIKQNNRMSHLAKTSKPIQGNPSSPLLLMTDKTSAQKGAS